MKKRPPLPQLDIRSILEYEVVNTCLAPYIPTWLWRYYARFHLWRTQRKFLRYLKFKKAQLDNARKS